MITLDNVEIRFEDLILRKARLDIPFHSVTLIRGESGSGKTSLLYRIGLISDDITYSYCMDDKDIIQMDNQQKSLFVRNNMSFVLQDNSLFEQYDVLGNLKLYSSFNQHEHTENDYRKMLEIVNLDVPFHQSVDTLSGGEKQRLAIACALCKETDILILDEPTSFLDEGNAKLIFSIIRRLADDLHKTVILSSHSPLATGIADKIYEIKNQELTTLKTYEKEEPFEKRKSLDLGKDFFPSYVSYFLKKYISFEILITGLMVMTMLMVSGTVAFVRNGFQNNIENTKSLSDNQIFITKSKDNLTIDSELSLFDLDIDIEGMNIIPYVPTYAKFDDELIPVIPSFPQNRFDEKKGISYSDENNFINYQLNMHFLETRREPRELKFNIVLFLPDGSTYEDHQVHQIGANLSKGIDTFYFKRQIGCLFVPYEELQPLYEAAHIESFDQYLGYTGIFEDYNLYEKEALNLKNTNYGINLSFEYFDVINDLQKINILSEIAVISISMIISGSLFAFLEIHTLKRRGKELMLLKMNGIDNRSLGKLQMSETVLQLSAASLISIIVLMMIRVFIKMNITKVSLLVIFIIALFTMMTTLIASKKYIKKLSVENILRSIN